MDRFYASWKDGIRAKARKLERLKAFIKFCLKREWLAKDIADDLQAPEGSSVLVPKTPFTDDLTSSYVEGAAEKDPMMQRGCSRDHRPDCKQLVIGLIVNPEGFPLSYEVFHGNRADVTTLEAMVRLVERKYGRARRVWVFDRGIVSEENLAFRARDASGHERAIPYSLRLLRSTRCLRRARFECVNPIARQTGRHILRSPVQASSGCARRFVSSRWNRQACVPGLRQRKSEDHQFGVLARHTYRGDSCGHCGIAIREPLRDVFFTLPRREP
jgi:hypothetical protein